MSGMNIVADLERFLKDSLKDFAQEVEATMRGNAPVYNGELIASIKTTKVSEFHYQVGPHTDHDWWAENGNGAPGVIAPGHLMKWVDAQGRPHAASKVRRYSAERYADGTKRNGHYAKKTVDKYT